LAGGLTGGGRLSYSLLACPGHGFELNMDVGGEAPEDFFVGADAVGDDYEGGGGDYGGDNNSNGSVGRALWTTKKVMAVQVPTLLSILVRHQMVVI
jgi:hypothetical protein